MIKKINLLFKELIEYKSLFFSTKKKAVYLGNLGKDNFGDECMYMILQQKFPEYTFLPLNGSFSSMPKFLNYRLIRLDLIILGGGTIIRKGFNGGVLRMLIRLNRLYPNVRLVCVGAGVGDDSYQKSIGHPNDMGSWKKMLMKFSMIGTRGADSKNSLIKWGITKQIIECYDPSIAMFEANLPKKLNIRKSKPLALGINVADLGVRIYGNNDKFYNEFFNCIYAFSKRNYIIKFFSTRLDDKNLLNKNFKGQFQFTHINSFKSVEKFYNEIDIVISQRLHGNAFAFVTNTPFIMIDYEPKCKEFFDSLKYPNDYRIRTDNLSCSTLFNKVSQIELEYDLLSIKMSRRREIMKFKFEEFIKNIK